MTELELMVDLHLNSERQGPGSQDETLKALSFINTKGAKDLKIADIGCGSGAQTLDLASNLNAEISALDLFPQFLEELNAKAEKLGLSDKIKTIEGSMDELPFEKESLDIIWSEGAIYNMGFENGIRQWKEYLKQGGYLAVSEITWITNSRPQEIEEFWMSEYAEMDIASNKIKILEDNGYTLSGYFYLSQDSWMENYYKPLESRFAEYLERHKHKEAARKMVDYHIAEVELFKKFKDFYSYGFYVAKKNKTRDRKSLSSF